MNSYIPYMGGKGCVCDSLVEAMPPEAQVSYIEVFLGGASVFISKPAARVNVLNDIDADIILTHQTVASDAEAVMAELARLPTSRLLYEETRTLRDSVAWFDLTPVQRSARIIYLHDCAFNGNPRSPFSASAMTPLRVKPGIDLRPFAEKLRHATFECLDWSELLDRYVLQPRKIRCLVFADPPYVAAIKSAHYRHRFDHLDHVMLARKLALINEKNGGDRSVKIMVTLDDDEAGFIRSLYRAEFGWYVRPLSIRYAAGHHSHETQELLLTNYDPDSVVSSGTPAPRVDWSDIPCDGQSMGGRRFEELSCCEKERFGLLLQTMQRGQCRACGAKVAVAKAKEGVRS